MEPDSTESTPSISSNTASRHQKQPPAKVVISRATDSSSLDDSLRGTRLQSCPPVLSNLVQITRIEWLNGPEKLETRYLDLGIMEPRTMRMNLKRRFVPARLS